MTETIPIGPSLRAYARKAGQIMLILLYVVLALVLVLVVIVLALSPGKPSPIVDAKGNPVPGSISEKVFVDINGIRQGMFIQSTDVTHPVLLYLHGGLPDYFLAEKYPTGLEDLFTVVWWEQRGSGISYNADIPRETLTSDQMISDTLAVTNYLRKRFGQDKIYLMGHSGGSFIGIQAAARAPELYHAYIGVAQMANQRNSEYVAYHYMLKQFQANGNTRMLQRLEAAPVTLTGGTPAAYLAVRDEAMHSLGIGTIHNMHSIITGVFLPSLASPQYTLSEKINMWRGKSRSGVSALWGEMLATDMSERVAELEIPVYFLEGRYDYTCVSAEARSYFDKLKAPIKGFYVFEQSAHSPMFEEPGKTMKIMREDVLMGKNTLADGK